MTTAMTSWLFLLVLVLTSLAFVVERSELAPLAIASAILLLHALWLGASARGIALFFVMQLTLTSVLYLILHDATYLPNALEAVVRLILATIPAWWLSHIVVPEQIAKIFNHVMPHRWAFIVSISLRVLPHLANKLAEVYQVQVLRGARITPKDLRKPSNWPELVQCVIFPVLIHTLLLSKQIALAAKCRHFGYSCRPTTWNDINDKD